jgi:hypothetical protein
MNFKELAIQGVEPLAVLTGGLDGTRFIARITKREGVTSLFFITPQNYDLRNPTPIEYYVLDSAIAKHGYVPTEHGMITTDEDYIQYISEINK